MPCFQACGGKQDAAANDDRLSCRSIPTSDQLTFPLHRHFALAILPGLINGDRFEQIQMLLLFFTGAAAMFYVAYRGNPETAFDEGPSLWCIVAIPQHLITYVVCLWHRNSGGPAKQLAPDLLVSVDNAHAGTSSADIGEEPPVRQRRRQRL